MAYFLRIVHRLPDLKMDDNQCSATFSLLFL